MKYLKKFTSKEDYKIEVMPQVSVTSNEVMFDTINQVVNISNINTDLKNLDKDYTLAGIIEDTVLKVSGNSIKIQNSVISGNIDKIESNAAIVLNESTVVEITDSNLNASTYNMVEIGLTGDKLPSLVNITNCEFGEMSNNAISIFGFQDNAVINIKNCHFKSVSNVLRLSNKNNANNVTVNIENCTCDKWELGQFSGFVLLQAFPIKNYDFSNITINITNLVGPNGLVTGIPETICGTKDDNQIIYLYTDNIKDYDSNIYPKININ